MSKTTYYNAKQSANDARAKLFYDYREKYFNLWLSSYKWTGLSRVQREYLMRRLWTEGSAAFFSIIDPAASFLKGIPPKDSPEADSSLIGIAPFAVIGYNMFNFPTALQLINERGVPYIPNRLMVNEKDVVIMYAQHSRQPISAIVDDYVTRIVNVEMTIRTNLYGCKVPLLVKVTPQDEQHAEDYQRKIENDEAIIFINSKETDNHANGGVGILYIIDKLYSYKTNLENELLTILGIDNIGNVEKKERLVEDEANANTDLVNDHGDSILENLEEGCDYIKKVLGFTISVKPKNMPKEAAEDDNAEDDNGEKEDSDNGSSN